MSAHDFTQLATEYLFKGFTVVVNVYIFLLVTIYAISLLVRTARERFAWMWRTKQEQEVLEAAHKAALREATK